MSQPDLDLGRSFADASDPCFVLDPGTCLPVEMSLTRVDRGDRPYVLGLVRDRSEHRHRP